MIYELEFNRYDYKKTVEYKIRETTNLEIRNKSLKSYKQDETKESSYENTNL